MLDAMTTQSITVRGQVEAVYFSSPTFSAGCLRADDGRRVKFAGAMLVQEHQPVVLRGRWEMHPKYGRQLQVEAVELDLDLDPEGLAHYLANHPSIKGIGPVKARRIALRFGGDFERVLAEEPQLIADEAHLPLATVEALREEWLRTKTVNAALVWLSSYGLTHHQVTTLVEKYANNVVAILKADPYLIVREIPGFGFRRVDQIALQIGTAKEHPSRLRSGVLFCVRERLEQGDCWVGYEQLIEQANEVLALDTLDSRELIEQTLEAALAAGELSCASYAGRFLVAFPEIRRMEEELAAVFSSGGGQNPHFAGDVDPDALIEEHAPDLNAGQRAAVRTALQHRMSLISGGAGSGKTYVSAAIAAICRAHELSVVLAAPTGKAAKRMEQVVGQEAFTLHRLLGYDGRTFALGADDPVDADVLIVDECFDYKQPVLTETGWRYIGEIVNSRDGIRVWSRDPQTGRLEPKPIVRWLKHPAPPSLLRIVAGRSGSLRATRTIRCTPDHKVLTPYGYRRAGDLRIGEEVIARGRQFTPEQRSILIGSLLGDGHLHWTAARTSPQVTLVNGDDQLDYLRFKQRAFGELAGDPQRRRSGYGDKPVWGLALRVADGLYEIGREMVVSGEHPSGRRRWTPTARFLEWVDAQALAIWYLDNGSLQSRRLANGETSHHARLHSERFSQGDNRRLVAHLEARFGLSPTVAPDARGHHFLRFSKADTQRLLEIVRPYTPACMSRKVASEAGYAYHPEGEADTCTARIQEIAEVRPTTGYVYDLEVADFHNYVAGNIVVSNCSMLDVPLAWQLFEAINPARTAVILVGDHNQLPPVGPGNILRDLIDTRVLPTVVLDEIVRQAGPLKENSIAVLHGEVRKTATPEPAKVPPWILINHLTQAEEALWALLDLHREGIAERLRFDLVSEVQVLTPTHKGPLGTAALNLELQRLLQRKLYGVEVPPVLPGRRPRFLLHDKVIQKRNNYDLGVMNGSIGQVVAVIGKGRDLVVRFFDREAREVTLLAEEGHLQDLQLAYALTIHSAQGSEFPCVVLVVHKSHSFQHHRNLFYTGVTRAQQVAIILGDQWGIRNCADKREVGRRKTFLSLLGQQDGSQA